MLFLRWLKHNAYMKQKIRQYLGYALGEIILVVAGILIALQINAWYDEKKTQQQLSTYAETILRNVVDDRRQIQAIREERVRTLLNVQLVRTSMGPYKYREAWYNQSLVGAAHRALNDASDLKYLVLSTGGYSALESSGLLSELSDVDLQSLLLEYYRTVGRVARLEADHNRRIDQYSQAFQLQQGTLTDIATVPDPLMAFGDAFFDQELAEQFKSAYLRLLIHGSTQALLDTAANQNLLAEYERLLTLGDVLEDQLRVLLGERESVDKSLKVFVPDAPTGSPDIFVDGLPRLHTLAWFRAPGGPGFGLSLNAFQLADDYMRVNLDGGQPCAFVYTLVGDLVISVEQHERDYSAYETIRLELRLVSGCDQLFAVIKDVEDPPDGSEDTVKLELSEDWQVYEYALSDFSTADLESLTTPVGFVMLESACRFDIKNISYH